MTICDLVLHALRRTDGGCALKGDELNNAALDAVAMKNGYCAHGPVVVRMTRSANEMTVEITAPECATRKDIACHKATNTTGDVI
eukprot:CAMPEP_0198148540 /NCGR_PEP_ID=MMETSP1443-20131203/41865_1 /TAXON_ID=186043 /ORGANISM="Entomoneis sp., Strain CCMP2396" /LENGTH=84 /DNA_ID=CAMNT_0043813247 /DNA_START=16 /DNA_END=271 /DNA_ORIENTATION=+